MGKSKDVVKSGKASKGDSSLKSVKASNVAKPAVDATKKGGKNSKEVAKAAASSDEESETSDSSASSGSESEDDSEEEETPKMNGAKANGHTNGKAKAVEEDSDESDDSGSSSESDADEAPAKKTGKANGTKVSAKAAAESDDSDEEEDSDDSDDSDEEAKPAAKKADDSGSEDEDSGSDDSSSEEDDEEEEKPQPNKRKADDQVAQPAKKSKVEEVDSSISPNLFVGSLSWNVDETMLREHFEQFGTLSGVRVMTDRNTGRSKGFGYVEYVEAASAKKAYENMKDVEIDGRTINLDYAKPNPTRDGGASRGNDRAQKYGDSLSEPSATLFVGNISFEASEEMLSEAFSEFGTLTGVRLPTDPDSGSLKGYGYVEFSTVEEATTAIEAMKGYNLAGRPIRLDYSTPRAGGGGGGGGGGRGRGGFGDRRGGGRGGGFGGRGGGRGGFGDRGGRGGRGGFGDRGGRGRGGFSTNRGGFGDFKGNRQKFD